MELSVDKSKLIVQLKLYPTRANLIIESNIFLIILFLNSSI